MSSTGEHGVVREGGDLPGLHPVVGDVTVRRIGVLKYPVWRLVADGKTLARMGRTSWWSIYFGFGQKVQFVDGPVWKVRSIESSGMISAVVVNADGLKVALASPGAPGYLIVGKDFSYRLFPDRSNSIFVANEWTLSSEGVICARVQRQPTTISPIVPIPVAAAIISIALVRVGIPGDKKLSFSSVKWTGAS